ncbi:pathogenicity-like protein [uncultured Stenotrophomonas sp.]|uniref:putative signal transducing protein n=1 Tax=uncultured Stenotrophomonas sp. TaxID=165438 RepID=UPI0028E3317A|nr:pathogenicity-like protein [uncultured Stenotrophomonas sp.]
MRQIFSSQRVETVEGVAQLLRDAGIEVRITNGRSYHSKRGSQFSYLDTSKASTHPTLWVVHANDQPRAREILRDARLLETTRRDHPTAEFAFRDQVAETAPRRNWAWRIRIGLLLVIAAVAMVVMMRHRSAPTAVPAPVQQAQPQTPANEPAPAQEEEEVRVRIQPVQQP